MIKLDIDNNNNILTEESIQLLKNIIPIILPQNLKDPQDISILTEPLTATITLQDNSVINASIKLSDNNELISILFYWDENNTPQSHLWTLTPMNEFTINAKLKPQQPQQPQQRSQWAIRQDMIDEAFSNNNKPVQETEMDGTYDVDPNFLLSSEDIEDILEKYWYNFQTTCTNYLKQNKILSTNIFLLSNVTNIELKDHELFVHTFNGQQMDFQDLPLASQLLITQELLLRIN